MNKSFSYLHSREAGKVAFKLAKDDVEGKHVSLLTQLVHVAPAVRQQNWSLSWNTTQPHTFNWYISIFTTFLCFTWCCNLGGRPP